MQWFYFEAVALLSLALLVDSTVVSSSSPGCIVKSQRKAWHILTSDEKLAYLDAERCLMKLPATLGLPGTRTRFDELQASHAIQAEVVHNVGAFLPFHRLLMHSHEYLLRTECGFNGTQPYWDEPLDAGNFSKSILFDTVVGFGGNGIPPTNCIQDGPFVDYINGIGPGHTIQDHCIDRKFDDFISLSALQSYVDRCKAIPDYLTAWPCMEEHPHIGCHGAVGGEMMNPISSPGDPLFYLHHTYLDKVWWDWQSTNLSSRLYDISGSNTQEPCLAFPEPPNVNGTSSFPSGGPIDTTPLPNGTCPVGTQASQPPGITIGTERPGDPGNITTLGHVLNMFGIVPNATIRDVMDIGNDFLCYEYV
ncbi:hypothetical protein VTL71DRAFT_14001 [Oculimacula yallundae]|uniref:Tyrosinase copper-binding domain-containing protein n=1 Tax=Oculimacula yallundae TaxID=86028 RepID=A0ABR4CMD4_9HELO